MAASSTSNLAASLKRIYSEKYFGAFQDEHTPILDELEEVQDVPPLGAGWYVEFVLNSPQNWQVGAEGQSMGTVYQRSSVQGTVNAVEFLGWFQITEMLRNAGKGAGAFGDELNRHMEETTKDITKAMQRLFSISHGTGRLAIVQDTTNTTSFTGKNPEGVVALMEGDKIDFYDADTSGSKQGNTNTITDIDRITRLCTITSHNLTADWGVYRAGAYGYAPNGLRGLVDNATYASSIHGCARSSYPKLNSRVRTLGGGTPTALEEEDMRKMCDDIFRVGGTVDRIMCNVGVLNAFFSITDGDRRYVMERGKTAQRVLGYKTGDALFSYMDATLPFKVNPNLPAREMYFLSWKKSFRQNTLRKLGFLEGANGEILLPTPGSGTYATSWIAMICAQKNISCVSPIWNGVIRSILDKSVAGDS